MRVAPTEIQVCLVNWPMSINCWRIVGEKQHLMVDLPSHAFVHSFIVRQLRFGNVVQRKLLQKLESAAVNNELFLRQQCISLQTNKLA